MNNFLDEFKGIKVGGKIRIKLTVAIFSNPGRLDDEFFKYLRKKRNRFTVKSIQEFEDDVIICVNEVNGILGSQHVEPYSINNMIINWRKNV